MKTPFLIIGGGLSGIAAAIRIARYCPEVLVLEQHSRIGGLNSYYYRNKNLIETGLHAITNYADAGDKRAPINKLFRQLKFKRKDFIFEEQIKSEIHFSNEQSLFFSNNIEVLKSEVQQKFPQSSSKFNTLINYISTYDAFSIKPFISAKQHLNEALRDKLLVDMLLCPLLYYGSSVENDMDLSQFVIMFKSIYLEGMFRPEGTMKEFLNRLKSQLFEFGGNIQLNAKVKRILVENKKAIGVELQNGAVIHCDHLLSTAGYEETLALLPEPNILVTKQRLGFVESVFLTKPEPVSVTPTDKTIIFFNNSKSFKYQNPETAIDPNSGVICFPGNFQNTAKKDYTEIRLTNLANYKYWSEKYLDKVNYNILKREFAEVSIKSAEKIIGNFSHNIVYQDTFTPVTIERYTSKKCGAIYGSPTKIKDGDIGYENIFLAGTDQGFLGIIGSMLSGVSIANQHFLPKI